MNTVNIVCLKWGIKYGPEYVNKLYAGIKRNTSLSFNLHCFTDDSSGLNSNIISHPLPYKKLDGWWNKLYLFSKEIPITGRILYIDLDTLITGNIDNILIHNDGFVVLRDFLTGIWPSITTNDSVGSGLISYESHKHSYIWEEFLKNPEKIIQSIKPNGDQVWIQKMQSERLYWQDLFQNQIVSFKVHCNKGLSNDARIVCYHGKPSIPDSINKVTPVHRILKDKIGDIQPASWVEQYWKD
jgi:hypothetical protein